MQSFLSFTYISLNRIIKMKYRIFLTKWIEMLCIPKYLLILYLKNIINKIVQIIMIQTIVS